MSQSPEFYILNGPSIIVDDFDPAIQYNGTWNAANETVIYPMGWAERAPLFNTLHVLQVFTGSFSYNFTGVGVSVFATPFDNTSYTSQCFLDGNAVTVDSGNPKFGQSRPVCVAFGLPANAVHTISVVVSVPPRNQADPGGDLSGFAFDYILIHPAPGVSLWIEGNYDVFLPILDTQFISQASNPTSNFGIILGGNDHDVGTGFDNGFQIANLTRTWNYDAANGFHTSTPGSQMNLTFTGTRLWWYGYYNRSAEYESLNNIDALFPATFAIDGGLPSPFPGNNADMTTSQAYISKTEVVQNGTHLVTVVYHGSNEVQPLTLQSMIIQRSSPLIPSSTVVSLPSITVSDLPMLPPISKHTKLGVVAGGAAGGVVFLLLIASGLYALTRWMRRKRQSMRTGPQSATTMPEPYPFPTEGHVPTLGPRKARASQSNAEHPLMQPLQAPPLTKWTRRNPILDSRERLSSSNTTITHERRHSAPVITRPLSADDSPVRPVPLDPASAHSVPHVLAPTTPAIRGFPNHHTDLDDGAREEDSGLRMTHQETAPILPPVYTTH